MTESVKPENSRKWELVPYAAPGPVREGDLHVRTVGVSGTERSYWSPTSQPRGTDVPLIVAMHGVGMTGRHMALGTDLARRATAAGFHVVFPDALERCWDDHGCGRRDDADDGLFIRTLVEHLRRRQEVASAPVFLTGVASGACLADRVARAALIDTAAIVLVGGTARRAGIDRVPEPRQRTAVKILCGTPPRERVSFRVRRSLIDTSGHAMVPAAELAANWQAVNAPDLPVDVVDAGSPWPGGSGKLRSRAPGGSALDATDTVIEFATSLLAN